MIAEAYVETSTPSKYINRLCKHFAHKVIVAYDENQGEISFKMGKGYIEKVDGGLILKAEADNQTDLQEVIDIMDRHFVRIAWQEELVLNWQENPA